MAELYHRIKFLYNCSVGFNCERGEPGALTRISQTEGLNLRWSAFRPTAAAAYVTWCESTGDVAGHV